jgi:hypothetical protein
VDAAAHCGLACGSAWHRTKQSEKSLKMSACCVVKCCIRTKW